MLLRYLTLSLFLTTVPTFLAAEDKLPPDDGKLRIVVFGAHPDDAEFKAGGTAIKWAKRGHHVKLCSVTNGDIGHWQMAGGPLAQRRATESAAAAKAFGVTSQVLDIVERNQGNDTLRNGIWKKIALLPNTNLRDLLRDRPLEIAEIIANPGTNRYKGTKSENATVESISLLAMPWMKKFVEAKLLDNAVQLQKLLPDDMAKWASVSATFKAIEDRQLGDKSKVGGLAAELSFPVHTILDTCATSLADQSFHRVCILVAVGAAPKVMPIDVLTGKRFELHRTAGGYDLVSPGRRSKTIKVAKP